MSDAPSTPREDLEASPATAIFGRASILAKIKVLLFVAVVILLECAVAYLYIPGAAQTAAMAGAALEADAPGNDPAGREEEKKADVPVDQIEVDIGEFSVTAFQPISNTTLRIDFHLYATVHVNDQKEFLRLMEENLHRFREQVIVTMRSADITDLTDAGLGLVKRKILEKANRTLGKPMLRGVIFSDFSFVEQ